MLMRKYLTIEDLLMFCKQSNMNTFSAQEAGGPIIVQSFGEISTSDTTTMGLTPCTLQACHTELNKNHSFIEDDVMNNALASFANRPILGYVHQLDDGSWDFWDHRMSIEENGNESRLEYLERPIGVIPESCNAHLEYDENQQKNYVVVNGYIYDDYGNQALDIIKSYDGKVSVSVELAINAMSYNAKENYLNIEDFVFMGVTCLGKTPDGTVVQPGMEGSNLKLDNFSAKQNSMFSNDFQDKMIEVLDKLNTTLSNFNNNSKEKGCDKMGKFEELLQQYNVTAEDITFEIEGLSDEELEVKFKEAFEDGTGAGDDLGTNKETGDASVPAGDTGVASTSEFTHKKTCSVGEDGNMTVSFEISHEDIRGALYTLLEVYEQEDNEWYWVTNVFDNYFIFENWDGNKLYKQSYAVDGDNVSLSGDRQEVFKMILTESEKLAIEKMREDYAVLETEYNELKTFKDNYDAAQVKAQKDAIFARDEYSVLAEDEAFKTLMADAAKFSVEEVESKVKSIFADFVIKTGEFSAKKDDKKIGAMHFSTKSVDEANKKPYGSLFNN
jgi:hypothetical protein